MQHREQPSVARTAQSGIAAELRRQVLAGELAAGTRLVQADLARAMGTSITPVREALRELAVEGLVDIDAFRGAVVHTPTAAEVAELYAIRHELVPLGVRRRLATLSEADVELAESLVDEMHDAADAAAWVELNRRFHRVVELDPIGSPHLTDLVRRLIDLSATYVTLTVELEGRRPDADRDHRELVAALRARDEARLVALVRAHLAVTLERARAAFARRNPV